MSIIKSQLQCFKSIKYIYSIKTNTNKVFYDVNNLITVQTNYTSACLTPKKEEIRFFILIYFLFQSYDFHTSYTISIILGSINSKITLSNSNWF